MYKHMYIHTYVYNYICMCVYIYIYIHMHITHAALPWTASTALPLPQSESGENIETNTK